MADGSFHTNGNIFYTCWGCLIRGWDSFGWGLRSMVHSAPFTRLVWYTYLREGGLVSSVVGKGGGRFTGVFVSPVLLLC